MKKIVCLFVAIVITISLSAQDFQEAKWQTGKDNTIVETYQKEGTWFGKVIASDNPKARIGKDIILDVKQKNGQWMGKLYAAKRNRLVNAMLEPSNGQLSIKISAMGRSRTLVWKRHYEK